MWTDPPTPRVESRKWSTTLWRLAIGMPIRDYNRPATPTFWRSKNAVTRRRMLNPFNDWPGWIKLLWRVLLYAGFGLWFWWRYVDDETQYLVYAIGCFLGTAATLGMTAWLINHGKNSKGKRMPAIVRFDPELRGLVHEIPIGKTWDFKLVTVNLKHDPHLLVAAKTGQGKSSILTAVIVWVRIHGGSVNILDPKMISYLWLRRIQGIDVWTHVEQWVEVVDRFYESLMKHYAMIDDEEFTIIDEDANPIEKPFHILVIDEMGTFVDAINSHWKDKLKKKGRPATLRKIQRILWLGRAANHFLVEGAHQANSEVTLSTDSRSQFMNKLGLGPQEPESVRMLYGQKAYKTRKRKGRGLLYNGDEFVDVQALYIPLAEYPHMSKEQGEILKVLSLCLPVPVLGQSRADLMTPELGVDVLGQPSDSQDADPDIRTPEIERLIPGRKGAAAYLNMTLAAFDKRRLRKPLEPHSTNGAVLLFTPEQLDVWKAT